MHLGHPIGLAPLAGIEAPTDGVPVAKAAGTHALIGDKDAAGRLHRLCRHTHPVEHRRGQLALEYHGRRRGRQVTKRVRRPGVGCDRSHERNIAVLIRSVLEGRAANLDVDVTVLLERERQSDRPLGLERFGLAFAALGAYDQQRWHVRGR